MGPGGGGEESEAELSLEEQGEELRLRETEDLEIRSIKGWRSQGDNTKDMDR